MRHKEKVALVVHHPEAMLAACDRKSRYGSEQQAREVGQRVLRADKSYPVRLWPYPCYHCCGWHLTKRDQSGLAITRDWLYEGVM